jgi:hypothetical protein
MKKKTGFYGAGKIRKVSIPCILNRASLGEANCVFAILRHVEGGDKVVYVPRRDITVAEQPILSEELKAWLKVPVKEKIGSNYLVIVDNNGNKQTRLIQKSLVRR